MTKRLTDIEIATRIVPTMLRWPPAEIAKTITWDRLRDAVDQLRGLIRTVDDGCVAAEQDTDLNPDGIARRRQTLGRQAISELANWPPLQATERAVTENIEYLEKRMVDLPQAATSVADVMMAQEVRAHVKQQKSPIDFVLKSLADPRVIGVVLNAAPYLSGLSDAAWNVVRERARAALHPEQQQMQQHLTKALDDLRKGVEAARRMVLERCDLRLDANGVARGIREPLPGGARAATKTAA